LELLKEAGGSHEIGDADCGLEPLAGMTDRMEDIPATEFVLFMRHLRNVKMAEEHVNRRKTTLYKSWLDNLSEVPISTE
jgi:hypothetical protein